jgi:hypothetical protein
LRFTVRRPPTGEVSPCGHRPSGGDVACSVDVGVAPSGIAGFALENRLALAVSGRDVPTSGASLRRERGRDLLDPAESFVLQTCDELAPAASADRAVEPAFLGDAHPRLLDGAARGTAHRPHIQSLDPDHVEPPREVSAGFLDPILTPIPLAGLQVRDRPFRPLPAVGTAVAAGEPHLQHLQPLRLTPSKTRDMKQFAGRQRRRHSHAAVNADHAAVARTADRVGDVSEREMPSACAITGNPIGPDTLRHRPRQAKSNPPDLGYPNPSKAAVQPLDVTWFQADLPKSFVYTGFAQCRAAVRAVEEVPHGLREIPQRLLLHRLAASTKPRILGACLRQLRGLLQIAGSLAARLPMPLLLHGQIPHIPCIPAVRRQCLLLLRGRQQPEPRHIGTVTATTDISGSRKPAPPRIGILPVPTSRVSSQKGLK